MNIREMDFRFIHLRFFFLEIENKNGELLLGYINRKRGIEFSVLGEVKFENNLIKGNQSENEKTYSYQELIDKNLEPLKYETVDERNFASKISKIIEENKVSQGVKSTRELDNLDDLRDKINPDIIIVHVVGQKGIEAIPVIMEDVLDTKVRGTALKSGVKVNIKKDDTIDFQLGKSGNKRICIAYL